MRLDCAREFARGWRAWLRKLWFAPPELMVEQPRKWRNLIATAGFGGESFGGAVGTALQRTQRRPDLLPDRPVGAGKRSTSHCIQRSRLEPPPRSTVAGGESSERVKRPGGAPMPLGLRATGLGRPPARKRRFGGLRERERAGPSPFLTGSRARPISGGLRRDGPTGKNEEGGRKRDLDRADLPVPTCGSSTRPAAEL